MIKHQSIKPRLWLISIATLVSLALPAYAGGYSGTEQRAKSGARAKTRKAAPHEVGVPELRSLDTLKEAFQRDGGKLRLLMILSPT
jgi:hypothetical protein